MTAYFVPAFQLVLFCLLAYSSVWTFYFLLPPIVSPFYLLGRKNDKNIYKDICTRIVVVIPAKNVEEAISQCISSIRAAAYHAKRELDIVVICDHCNDATARLALIAGATIINRDRGPLGKSHSLHEYFDAAGNGALSTDLFIVTDSTTIWTKECLSNILISWNSSGSDIVIGRAIADKSVSKYFNIGTAIALQSRHIQNVAREKIGFNPLIEGRIMAFGGAFIKKYGWSLAAPTRRSAIGHPTEDWRHGLHIGITQIKVDYCALAVVYTPLRRTDKEAWDQGRRWDRGRRDVNGDVWNVIRQRQIVWGSAKSWVAIIDAMAPPQISLLIANFLSIACSILSTIPFYVVWSLLNLVAFIMYWFLVIKSTVKELDLQLSAKTCLRYIGWRIRVYFS